MDLMQIAVFCAAAVLYALIVPGRWRAWVLMLASLVAMYYLQPTLTIPQVDFILPTLTIALTVAGWWLTRPPDETQPERRVKPTREDGLALLVVLVVVLGLSATRYLAADFRLTSRPPEPLAVGLWLAVGGVIFLAAVALLRRVVGVLGAALVAMVGLFVLIKTPALAEVVAGFLRAQQGRDVRLATATELEWLGFSYVAFRLIHTLRDRQMGRLPGLSLREYVTYVVFFPAYTAGPIDRAERFVKDFRALADKVGLDVQGLHEGATRITVGLFKKFVIADSLALIALDSASAQQATDVGALWLLTYAYALRLFFDFSGYSDIAIGIGILFGVKLPENFDRPYLKNNIMAFWQSWHMTLSNWVRFYIFSPLSRALLRRKPKPSNEVIMFVSHMSTMIVIGLWHGITPTFFIWGAWHGLGLFVHKTWSDRTRKWYMGLKNQPGIKRAWTVVGVLLTFHFVTLGWVWFALPDFELAAQTFGRLLGVW